MGTMSGYHEIEPTSDGEDLAARPAVIFSPGALVVLKCIIILTMQVTQGIVLEW